MFAALYQMCMVSFFVLSIKLCLSNIHSSYPYILNGLIVIQGISWIFDKIIKFDILTDFSNIQTDISEPVWSCQDGFSLLHRKRRRERPADCAIVDRQILTDGHCYDVIVAIWAVRRTVKTDKWEPGLRAVDNYG